MLNDIFSSRLVHSLLLGVLLLVLIDGFRPPRQQIVSHLLVRLIGVYQNSISPMIHLGGNVQLCRFHPTCSEYARIALDRHGLYKGLFLSVWRILRCNPFCQGGIDWPPPGK